MGFSKRLYKAFADDPDVLGVKLHTHYVCKASSKEQKAAVEKIDRLLKKYDDRTFLSLAYNRATKRMIQAVIDAKDEPGWEDVLRKYLKSMKENLERELEEAKHVPKPSNILHYVIKELKKLKFDDKPLYHKGDILEIKESRDAVKVNYISIMHSPDYRRPLKFWGERCVSWRDTQLIFTLNFSKGLFIWNYINIHKSLQGKGFGPMLVNFAEKLAHNLGFRRFLVQWPNRKFWCSRKGGYKIAKGHTIEGSGNYYVHEAYKIK